MDYDDSDFTGSSLTHRASLEYEWYPDLDIWLMVSTRDFKVKSPFEEYSNRKNQVRSGLVWDSSDRHRWGLYVSYAKKNYPDFPETYINKSVSVGMTHTLYLTNRLSMSSSISWFDRNSTRDSRDLSNFQFSSGIRWFFRMGKKYKDTQSTYRYFYSLASQAIESGQIGVAKKYLSHLINLGYEDAELLFEMGYCAYENNDFKSAVKWLIKAIHEDEMNLQSYYLLAYSYLELEEDVNALEILRDLSKWVDDPTVDGLIETLN